MARTALTKAKKGRAMRLSRNTTPTPIPAAKVLACLALSLLAWTPTSANAQVGGPFDLSWNSIDCGGASAAAPSTGGIYEVSGVIGQPDAGSLAGGIFDVAGGLLPAMGSHCRADYDGNGRVEPADVSLFITVWFASLNQGTLAGDFNGNTRVEPSDVSLFVATWASGLSGGC